MTNSKPSGISIRKLDAVKASAVPFEFEYTLGGVPQGIWLSVLGGQAAVVTEKVNDLMNERRQAQAIADLNASTGGRKPAAYVKVETDIEFGQRVAAVRLVGWRRPGETEGLTKEQIARFLGIEEAYDEDLALELCQSNADLSSAVSEKSNDMANFMKGSSPA